MFAAQLGLLAGRSARRSSPGAPPPEQNMAEPQKQHLVPGKQIHATGPNYQFCEVALIYGTSPGERGRGSSTTRRPAPNTARPEQFAPIENDKAQIIKDNGARDAWSSTRRRHWTWDEFWVYEVGDERQFGPVKMAWMGVVPVAVMKKAVGAGHYHPGQISRNNKYLFKKGSTVYLLDTPDGKVLVMQSWTNFTSTRARRQPTSRTWAASSSSCRRAGSSATKVLDRDLTVQPPAPNHLAWVTQDEFKNTYQGCGYDDGLQLRAVG